jgi:hypothetical protein
MGPNSHSNKTLQRKELLVVMFEWLSWTERLWVTE